MENPQSHLKIPNQLCQQIFHCQFQIDIGNVTEERISKTIQLYSQAIIFFFSQKALTEQIRKRGQFYKQKIKRLLTRKDVEKCLVGKRSNPKYIEFEQQIQKIKQSATQQAKALLQFYKIQHANQQILIKKTAQEQNLQLSERIAQRSRSKSNSNTPDKNKINPLNRKQLNNLLICLKGS